MCREDTLIWHHNGKCRLGEGLPCEDTYPWGFRAGPFKWIGGLPCRWMVHGGSAPPTISDFPAYVMKREKGRIRAMRKRKYDYRPSRHVLRIIAAEEERAYLRAPVSLWRLVWVNPNPPK